MYLLEERIKISTVVDPSPHFPVRMLEERIKISTVVDLSRSITSCLFSKRELKFLLL